jgi:hypothetical protein
MINLTTVSDYNYLVKGLALYESLLKTSDDFVLHYLCIDDESYNKLIKYECENLKVYNINDLLNSDESLMNVKNSEYRYFCWSLASYFTQYLMLRLDVPLIYIDSDIYFHQNINDLYMLMGSKSIGLFKHRQFTTERPEGAYNVGVCYFNNDVVGKHILNWWADAVLHKKYPQLATCGDQKYLDAFPLMCPGDLFFDEKEIGHGAPWLWQLYDFTNFNDGNIIWNGVKQKLYFTHFSQFVYNDNNYIPSSMHHIYTPLNMYNEIPSLKQIYDEYYNNLKEIIKKYGF